MNLSFAFWILREARGMSQRQLARRVPATRQQIGQWENGAMPTLATFERVCSALEVSPSTCLQIAEARCIPFSPGMKKPAQSVTASLPQKREVA
jgi:transcriptional regulator with XRE-family HTH domain